MRKKLSIIQKLTFWYSLVIVTVSAVLFMSFYQLTNRYLMYETDRSLSLHSSQVAHSIGLTGSSIHDRQTQNILELSQQETPGIYVQIVDSNGLNIEGNTSNFTDIALKAISLNTPQFTQTRINDFSMRVIAYPILNDNTSIGAVIMGHQIEVYENTLAQIRTVGALAIFFLILPSILIGYWLAKSAIDPIKKLGTDINKINSENLSRHLKVEADSEEADLLVNNFNSLLDRLSNAFTIERQFLGEMAHEIKTPLTVIKSNSEITLSKLRSPEEYQKSINQTLNQINKLTKNLLSLMDFAWAQSSDIKKQFREIDLTQLMKEIAEVAEYAASPKNISIKSEISTDVQVLGKEEKLYQAIYNIVDNAIKFTPKNGTVAIKLFKEGGNAVIEISDTGAGIEKEHLKNIFNRFYRTESTKNIAGHGLGLAITDSIIKAHDGTITVQSEIGKGSVFRILLETI